MLLVLRNHKQQGAWAASACWELELLACEVLLVWAPLAWALWDEWEASVQAHWAPLVPDLSVAAVR